jgi:DNA-binding response OmpR family regulator
MNMKDKRSKILLVDDDITLCELLTEFLSGHGFDVYSVYGGRQAISAALGDEYYDVMVLDIMMPEMNGLEVLQEVRAKTDLPIIMLTGRGDDIDRIIGLEMGADDYLGKPCNPRELLARINAVLRRTKRSHQIATHGNISAHGILLKPGQMSVKVKGHPIKLTGAEFRALQLLMENPGEVLTKSYLTEQVLNRELSAYDRSIDVHISRIRQKLSSQGGLNDVIKSVRGQGYQFALGYNLNA